MGLFQAPAFPYDPREPPAVHRKPGHTVSLGTSCRPTRPRPAHPRILRSGASRYPEVRGTRVEMGDQIAVVVRTQLDDAASASRSAAATIWCTREDESPAAAASAQVDMPSARADANAQLHSRSACSSRHAA